MRFPQTEGFVPVVTMLAFVALVGAGISSFGDPDTFGRATMGRMAGEVAGTVVAEWDRVRGDPVYFEGELMTWSVEPASAEAERIAFSPAGSNVVAEALLIESRRLDYEDGDGEGALVVVTDVLRRDLGPERRVAVRLWGIQLAVRLGRMDLARELWLKNKGELNGLEAATDTSLLLLSALAAGPALDAEQQRSLRDELVGLWISGRLALPGSTLGGNARREAFRSRLQALGELPDPRLDQHATRELAREIGELVHGPLVVPINGDMVVVAAGEAELLYRRKDERTLEGRLVEPGTTAAWLNAAVAEADLLPEGFSLDTAGDDEAAGPIVRGETALRHGTARFVVRHANPDALISRVSERQTLLRGAFFVLALGVAAAGLSAHRARRRERHLAEVKSTFVASVSHELRTPIASILLMVENLDEERVTSTEARARYYKLIRREADRLRRLVDDVLDFSRVEQGKSVSLCLGGMEALRFSKELGAAANAHVTAAGGELAYSIHELPQRIVVDRDALRRATLNLIDNALRHSGCTRVELELRGERDGFVILVRDQGRGVPVHKMENLFRPFERLESSMDPNTGSTGTGLGLAIVREIAQAHGGTAVASENHPSGVEFAIHLPTVSEKEQA